MPHGQGHGDKDMGFSVFMSISIVILSPCPCVLMRAIDCIRNVMARRRQELPKRDCRRRECAEAALEGKRRSLADAAVLKEDPEHSLCSGVRHDVAEAVGERGRPHKKILGFLVCGATRKACKRAAATFEELYKLKDPG